MLNRDKLFREIESLNITLFPDNSLQLDLARHLWEKAAADPTLIYKVRKAKDELMLAGWIGGLGEVHSYEKNLKHYSLLSVDGSQIYPDRNLSIGGCFLLNIGTVFIKYGKDGKVLLASEPYLFANDPLAAEELGFSKDMVDLYREEYELKGMLQSFLDVSKEGQPPLCLFDGSLIFWYLESKPVEVKSRFISHYLSYLNQFYENKALVAGYISMPRSKELISLLKLVAREAGCDSSQIKQLDSLIDSQIVRQFLEEGCRTTAFASNSKIASFYPEPLKPYFLYLDVGLEIIRLELPAWIAQDSGRVETICKIVLDQCQKGRGYPISLAEAHEQAVVKSHDKEFFYSLIYKKGLDYKKRFFVSQKSLKKRSIGV